MFANMHLFHAVEQFLPATGTQKTTAAGTPGFGQSCVAGSRTALEQCYFVHHFGWNQILLHFHFSDYFSTPIVPYLSMNGYERSAKNSNLIPISEREIAQFKVHKSQKNIFKSL
jgi:hypothetical protein